MLPPFDVFFYTIKDVPKVMVFMYALNPATQKYTAAVFDNYNDHVVELSLEEMKDALAHLHKEQKPYHYLEYGPHEMYEIFCPQVSTLYDETWFESKYTFIFGQATLAGYQSLLTVKH